MGPAEISRVDMGIECTVMAIREELMRYYKGTYVDRVTSNRNVQLMPASERGDYYFQRRANDIHRNAVLLIGDVPIATVKCEPDELTFYPDIVSRSPQLRRVHGLVEEFMSKYLTGVKVAYLEPEVKVKRRKEVDDTELVTVTQPRTRNRERTQDDLLNDYIELQSLQMRPSAAWTSSTNIRFFDGGNMPF